MYHVRALPGNDTDHCGYQTCDKIETKGDEGCLLWVGEFFVFHGAPTGHQMKACCAFEGRWAYIEGSDREDSSAPADVVMCLNSPTGCSKKTMICEGRLGEKLSSNIMPNQSPVVVVLLRSGPSRAAMPCPREQQGKKLKGCVLL